MSDNLITKQQMDQMVALYKVYKDDPAAESFPKTSLPYFATYCKEAFDLLVQTQGCTRIAIKFGMTEDAVQGLLIHPIIVALDGQGKELLPGDGDGDGDGGGVIVDEGQRCPPDCPPQCD